VIREIHLPRQQPEDKAPPVLSTQTLSEVERAYIIEVLRQFQGKISGLDGAAEFLDIPATTLHSKIKKLKISKADYF
jgi:transcriptional regulator with GAF, ATPase, and Fis domain